MRKQIAEVGARKRRILEYLYDTYEVGVDIIGGNAKNLARDAGMSNPHTGEDLVRLLIERGVMERVLTYGERPNGNMGRVAHWKLLVPREEAFRRYDAWAVEHVADIQTKNVKNAASNSKYAAAKRLVEAARAYTNRGRSLNERINQLKKTAAEIGATIDEEAIRNALRLTPDPEMELIAKTLPYIESLEARATKQLSVPRSEVPSVGHTMAASD